MRTRLMRGKFTLLFMMLGLLLAVPAIAFAQDVTGSTTSPVLPTIQSDKADYAPGELVTLTGSGWQAGESVNIVVNDDVGQTWNRNVNVIADPSGNISDSFNLPDWFVAAYSVTATSSSGTATTSFTDGNIQVRAMAGTTNLAVTFPMGSAQRFNATTTCSGSADLSNLTAFTTPTDGTYVLSGINANQNQSAKITAPSPITSGGTTYNFNNWTSTTTGVTVNSSTNCISRPVPGNPTWDMTANYVEAPKVSSIVKADADPTNASSVKWTVTFSKSVTDVNIGTNSDFALVSSSSISGASITNLSGSGTTYTVTANTGSGDGTLGLNLVDNDSIIAGAGNPLGGTGTTTTGNGSFTGQVYTIDKTAPAVTIVSTNPDTLEETGSSTITWKANETGTYSVRVGGTDCATATQVPSGSGTNLSGNYTTANTNIQTTVDAAALAEGSNTIRICVTDAATNVGSNTTTITKNLVRATTTTLARQAGSNNPSTYGDSVTFTATVTASAGNPNSVGTVDFKNDSTVICDDVPLLSGNTATCSPSLNAGSYSLTAEYSGTSSGSPRFAASTSSALSHTVNKKELTVTAANKSKTYGDPNPAFTFAYSGGFVGTDTEADIDTAPTCTSTATATSSVTGSPYAITCSGGSDNNYSFKYVDGQLNIDPKAATVTADDKQITYGDPEPSFGYHATGLIGTDTLSGVSCGVSGAHTNVGTYDITCSGNTNTNYNVTTYNKGTLTVNKKELTVTADNQTKTLGQADPSPFTFKYSGFVSPDTATVIDTAPTCSVSVTHTNVGTYDIVCSGGLDNNYSFKYVKGTLNIVYGGGFLGIQQPINGGFGESIALTANSVGTGHDPDFDDDNSRFKLGSTVPVKFELRDTTGAPVTNAIANLTVKLADNKPDPGVEEPVSTSAATSGNAFRLSDATTGQYIFNLSTKSPYTNPNTGAIVNFTSQGTYTLSVLLNDGTSRSVNIQLVK